MSATVPNKTDGDRSILSEKIESTKNSLQTERLDMSFGEIMNIYEDSELIINPEFQRLFRWSKEQQTRFIESLVLGIPIPPIFVAEDDKGKWELVDGLQRISTVLSFFGLLRDGKEKNKWTMSEGELVEELEGYNVDNFPFKSILNIKRTVCRVEIIKWNSRMDMRYELFNRLNTGGTPLTEQEIRNCIFRGTSTKFNEYLTEMSSISEFIELVKITKYKVEKMYLEELVLRFTSLVLNWNDINESLSNYMTKFMKNAVEDPDFNYDKFKNLFVRTVNLLSEYGSEVFLASNYSFSTSLFEGITIGVANNIDYYERNKDILENKIIEIKNDNEFGSYMGSAASSKSRVKKRIQRAIKIFSPE